ncbi:MAG: GNAT family N-acetyltransferase [Cyanobacteria bacterium P01_D01_bin.116]
MLPVLESQRLIILPWIPEVDAPQAFATSSNSNVSSCLSYEHFNIQEENIHSFKKFNDGSGFWAIIGKQTQEFIGGILLKKLYDINENPTFNYEIGWHIHQEYSGKGYATEAALKIMNYGFHTLNLPALIAIIDPKNTASLKVAHKLGMTSLGITNNYYNRGQELFYIKSECENIFS